MNKTSNKPAQTNTLAQLLINFVIPLSVLMYFSDDTRLGPAKAMIVALAFPIGLELYNLSKRRKPSLVSLIAIGGILVTGAVVALGLSENWLALRRAAPYLVAGLVILVSVLIKRSLLGMLLPHVLDIDKVRATARKRKVETALERSIVRATYATSFVLLVTALISFILTRVIIDSPPNSAAFNAEYARLRLISLAAVTLPLLLGVTLVLFYLVSSIEKLTGFDFEKILKKK